jgi:hypothetical protein
VLFRLDAMMLARMKAPYPMYDLEGGVGVPAKEFKAPKGRAMARLRDNKAFRVRQALRWSSQLHQLD